jgi:hypothetical protein
MKRSLKNLKGFTIEAIDGEKGKAKDFLFDEAHWRIRYLEADYGSIFNKTRVLVPRTFFKKPDWSAQRFPVNLDKDTLASCPHLEEKATVSRKFESKILEHYQIPYYWQAGHPAGPAGTMVFYPPRPLTPPSKIPEESEMESRLRSYREVMGYHVRATDDKMGHIDDIIIDDEDWQITYVILDTSNWLPGSKKVLMAVDWLHEISYVDREVSIGLSTKTIQEAPEYYVDRPIEKDFEEAMYNFYQKSFVQKSTGASD